MCPTREITGPSRAGTPAFGPIPTTVRDVPAATHGSAATVGTRSRRPAPLLLKVVGEARSIPFDLADMYYREMEIVPGTPGARSPWFRRSWCSIPGTGVPGL